MRRSIALRLAVALAAVLAAVLPNAPASAGGWAVVHLDAAPVNVAVEVPVRIGFIVLQHDVTPVNVEDFGPEGSVTLEAMHRETAETYRAAAEQEGTEGHYVVEAVFPRAGEWKWNIVPAPFAGTSFETLTVLDAPAAPSALTVPRPGRIIAGSCGRMGKTRFTLGATAPAAGSTEADGIPTGSVGARDAFPVSISETPIGVALAELIDAPHAITVESGDPSDPAPVVCGDVGGRIWNGELVVGLRTVARAGVAGIATLREDAGQTYVTVYLVTVPGAETDRGDREDAASAATYTVAVDIVDMGFSPSALTVPAGTTVVWTNTSAVTHTVTGNDVTFADSGPMAAGALFEQTFDRPGIYAYRCGPHPGMTGTITVT